MSRLGLHIKTGPRNGIALVLAKKPAFAFAVGEGGVLLEAKALSDGHTWTAYRDIKYYGDNPNINNMTVAQAEETADNLYPFLMAQWLLNPADYYAVINETGANDRRAIEIAIAYENRLMELAHEDGFKLCICNLFSGTPDDGSVAGGDPTGGMETWKELYGPHIAKAFAGGSIYGRHVYGFDDLVPLTNNTDRPFREAEWLESQGLHGGIAITELGLGGGYKVVPESHMMNQIAQYDALMQATRTNKNYIVGGAWWTYGDWHGVNIQDRSPALAAYLEANPSEPWAPPGFTPPPPEETLEKYLWAETVKEQSTCGIRLNDDAALEDAIKAKGLIPVISEITREHGSQVYTVQTGEDLDHVKPRENFVWQPGQQIWSFTDPTGISPGFKLSVWPAETWNITQRFGENPANYDQYCDPAGVCLKGHNGWDIAAPMGSKFFAAAGGQVVWVSDQRPSGGDSDYGWHVRVQTGDYTAIYAHMEPSPLVEVGQNISAGHLLGYSGNTGNSTGPHLHFELRHCPGLPDWPWCIIDCTPFMEEIYKPPVSGSIDMRPYFRPVEVGNGPFFVLQHKNGPTEDIQVQMQGESIYVVKNRQYEHMRISNGFIERREDTSHGNDTLYTLDDGYGWSRWCPEKWSVGDSFFRSPKVTVMTEACNLLSEDENVGSWLRFDVLHKVWTSPASDASPIGITFENVVEMSFAWSRTGDWLERYWIAPHLGPYVQWMKHSGEHSWVSEIPAGRPPLQREIIHCLG